MWTKVVALGYSYRKCCKNEIITEVVALGYLFLFFVAVGTGFKIDGVSEGGGRSKVDGLVMGNRRKSGTLKRLQTPTADLQSAVSSRVAAGKQPT